MIEQLHFTWSETGLQGRGRFQVTAASPGLQDLSGDLAHLALRLCRWSGADGQDVVSFGWIDARGHRFVFRRVPAGRTSDGRPGRFAAHVLVAPDGTITVADILQHPAVAGVWWSGEQDVDSELPCLRPQAVGILPVSTAEPDEALRDATAQILVQHGAGQVPAEWHVLLTAMARCSSVIPSAVADLTSFSTYEHGEAVGWFRLVGVGRQPSRQPDAAVAFPAARLIVSSDGGDTRAARAAAEATDQAGRLQWREFLILAAVLQRVRSDEVVGRNALLPALKSLVTVGELLQMRQTRHEIADALAKGDKDVSAALGANARGINPHLLRQLGIDLAERRSDASRADQSQQTDWVRVVGAGQPLGRYVLDGIAEAVLRRPDPYPAHWPGALLQACLRSPALPAALVPDLAQAVAATASLPPTLTDTEVTVTNRSCVAVAALSLGQLTPISFARFAVSDRELFTTTLPRLHDVDLALQVLEALQPQQQAQVLTEIAADCAGSVLLAACQRLAVRLIPARAAAFLGSLPAAVRREHAHEWEALRLAVLRAAAQDQMGDVRQPMNPGHLLAACPPGAVGQSWKEMLNALRLARVQPDRAFSQVAVLLQARPLAEDAIARNYALQTVVPLTHGTVGTVLMEVFGSLDTRDLASAVVAADRTANLGHAVGAGDIVREVIEIVVWSDRADREILDACSQLARWLDHRDWAVLKHRLEDAPAVIRRRLMRIYRRPVKLPGWAVGRVSWKAPGS